MAERNRRGKNAADERVEDVFDDAVDEPIVASGAEGRGTRAVERTAPSRSRTTRPTKTGKKKVEREGIFARIGRFIREVVAELRKVIWPTRKELVTYTVVVVVFVSVVLTIVGLMDAAFAWGVLRIFGNG